MKLLTDENIPAKLVRYLESLGHDITKAELSAADTQIIKKAVGDKRLIITLDKDFEAIALSSKEAFDAILIRIHPPYADSLVKAFQNMLANTTLEKIGGFSILTTSGLIRIK